MQERSSQELEAKPGARSARGSKPGPEACMGPSARERFRVKVEVGAECWEWLGFRHPNGYGRWHPTKRGPSYSAHRVAFELAYGPIPEGLCVCHRCDNRGCVNPAHLFLGTLAENNADKCAKGRQVRGERNGQAKLTAAQVREIRGRATGKRVLAREFGVSRSTVLRIRRGQKWAHIVEAPACGRERETPVKTPTLDFGA